MNISPTAENVLFIAPLPPPIDGQSKASYVALEAIKEGNLPVNVVNINRSGLSRSFVHQARRVADVLLILAEILARRRKARIVFLSLSESVLGNIKDLLIYCLLIGKLNGLTIQMLGGSGMSTILNRRLLLSRLNRFFMRRMNGVIVEGRWGREVFAAAFPAKKIHIVKNFVDEYLFVSEDEIRSKFARRDITQILYLSNMIFEKGYLDLLAAFVSLPPEIKCRYCLKFVGGFPEEADRAKFLKMIADEPSIEYLGRFIDGIEKKALYYQTHIFCLPTYYPFEGQPISILEAYASGCVVVTTLHGGIPDVFGDGINGFGVSPKDPDSIAAQLIRAASNVDTLERIALNNMSEAREKYRISRYKSQIREAIAMC